VDEEVIHIQTHGYMVMDVEDVGYVKELTLRQLPIENSLGVRRRAPQLFPVPVERDTSYSFVSVFHPFTIHLYNSHHLSQSL